MPKSVKIFITILTAALVTISCKKIDLFEQTKFFKQHQWASKDTANFTFNIADTNSMYKIFVVLRHEDAYHYNNIWMNITTTNPAGKTEKQLVELQLADNKNGWLGSGMTDVYDHRVAITRYPIKMQAGNYTFSLQHAMREQELQYILQAGIRVQKIVN